MTSMPKPEETCECSRLSIFMIYADQLTTCFLLVGSKGGKILRAGRRSAVISSSLTRIYGFPLRG